MPLVYNIQILKIISTSYNMPYSLKADTSVICQCGCIVSKYYLPKNLQTAKHELLMVGRENIEVVYH